MFLTLKQPVGVAPEAFEVELSNLTYYLKALKQPSQKIMGKNSNTLFFLQ